MISFDVHQSRVRDEVNVVGNISVRWELAGFLENVVKMTKKKVYGRWGGGVWVRGAKRIKVGLVWYVGNVE